MFPVFLSLSVTLFLFMTNRQHNQGCQGLSLMMKWRPTKNRFEQLNGMGYILSLLLSLSFLFPFYIISQYLLLSVCVWSEDALCVCLSNTELIEVIGGAHAEAGRWKKKSTALNLLSAQHPAKKSPPLSLPLSLSSYTTLYTLVNTHINRKAHMFNLWPNRSF